MQIPFDKLIKVAPFEEQTRHTIISSLPTLSEDQIFQLTTLAWKLIAGEYMIQLKERTDLILLEVAEGKRTYNKNDFVEAEVALYHELANKFEIAEKEEVVNVLKEEITKHQSPPNSQPIYPEQSRRATNNLQPSSPLVTPTQGTPKPTS